MAGTWDPVRVKAQLRIAAQRLAQLQDKKDSSAQITKRDIATLLQSRNVALARTKAQNLMREDAAGDLMEILEMHCGIILEQFSELERGEMKLSPAIVESASSIIYAAPQTESKDLNIVRDMLILRLGPDFTRSALNNIDHHVSPKVLRALSPPSSAADLDDYLLKIATASGVSWEPEMRPHEKVNALSELLDPSTSVHIVDISNLRRMASSGIPDHPPWLRPRVWKLLLGTLPPSKLQWESEILKQRASYYDLVKRLLGPVADRPAPKTPTLPSDRSLLALFNALTRVPAALFAGLEQEPESSPLCPLHDAAPPEFQVACSGALDERLLAVQDRSSKKAHVYATPEIRLESEGLNGDEGGSSVASEERRPVTPTTLHPSQAFKAGGAHQKHISALLRLIFIHASLHPADHSPHIASLLVPLYSVLNKEIEATDVAHVEADAFWLFEALVAEVAELEEEEGGNLWMRKLGERVRWADEELFSDLQRKGLDPAQPHYSYRWLAPILAHTLPLSSVTVVWDAVLSQPIRSRASNFKLDCLVDICTAMLMGVRARLLRLGKGNRPSLWNEVDLPHSPLSRSRPWELGDAFMEGMTLLQVYPINEAGGIERVLQVASDLAGRREDAAKAPRVENITLGAKLRNTVWRGLTNQPPSPDESPESEAEGSDEEEEGDFPASASHDDGTETETPGLASRWRSTVWRGITNQSSMEVPPSPGTPLSVAHTPHPSPRPEPETPEPSPSPSAASSIWGFTGKLKDSDMVAKLSKVSTNWTVKAMTWNTPATPSPVISPPSDAPVATALAKLGLGKVGSLSLTFTPQQAVDEQRRGSLPNIEKPEMYSPPARPAFFRPPRDSWMLQPRKGPLISGPASPDSASSSPPQPERAGDQTALLSITDWTGLHAPEPKPAAKLGPRPLLLNPSSLITPTPQNLITRSATNTPSPQWSDSLRGRPQRPGRNDSISSNSTVDLDRARRRETRSDWDSDTSTSRIVRLNRGGVSPMAPTFKAPRRGLSAASSMSVSETGRSSRSVQSPDSPYERTTRNTSNSPPKGWERADRPDSPTTLPSSPPPCTPVSFTSLANGAVRVSNLEHRESVMLSDSAVASLDPGAQTKKPIRKLTPPLTALQSGDTSDSSTPSKAPAPRVRSKRYGQRPPNLRVQDTVVSRTGAVLDPQTPSPGSLVAPELPDGDMATTPRATDFPSMSPTDRPRRAGKEGEARPRKLSNNSQQGRVRKVSTDGYHRRTESAADEGDDEGYDELLSAYESEEGSNWSHLHD